MANPSFADYYAFKPIVAAIARESAAYKGQVYLFNGDSHVYNSDQPLGALPGYRFNADPRRLRKAYLCDIHVIN